jgi:hypothetical protein
VCSQVYMPGINPLSVNNYLQVLEAAPTLGSVDIGVLAPATTGMKDVNSEPPLECYVFATCSGAAAPTLRLSYTRRGHTLRVLVRTLEGDELVPVPDVSVKVGRRHAVTGARGRAKLTVRPWRRYRLIATRPGCNPAVRTI